MGRGGMTRWASGRTRRRSSSSCISSGYMPAISSSECTPVQQRTSSREHACDFSEHSVARGKKAGRESGTAFRRLPCPCGSRPGEGAEERRADGAGGRSWGAAGGSREREGWAGQLRAEGKSECVCVCVYVCMYMCECLFWWWWFLLLLLCLLAW